MRYMLASSPRMHSDLIRGPEFVVVSTSTSDDTSGSSSKGASSPSPLSAAFNASASSNDSARASGKWEGSESNSLLDHATIGNSEDVTYKDKRLAHLSHWSIRVGLQRDEKEVNRKLCATMPLELF